MAAWVTIEDAQWWIGFMAPLEWVSALVAGCAGNPESAEDLLVASDFYRRGLAATVADRLLLADRARRSPATADSQVAEGHAFAADGPATRSADDGEVRISLARRQIQATGRVAQAVRQRGEIEVFGGERLTGRFVTYQLPRTWTLRAEREAM